MPEQDYGLTGSVSDPNSYPEMEGVDWNNASNRMAYIQNQSNKEVSSMVNDSGDFNMHKLESILNSSLDDSTKDYLVQWMLGEKSNQIAWDRQMDASNTQYQRAVADLQKAGLNPFLALQSLGGSTPSSSGQSVSGGLMTSKSNNQRDYQANVMKVLALLALVASRVMMKK